MTLFLAVFAGVMIFLGSLAAFRFLVPFSWSTSEASSPRYIAIPFGTSTSKIALQLSHDGVIASVFWFRFYSRILGYDRQLKAGFFELNSGMSIRQILHKIGRRNEPGSLLHITIPEGARLIQIGHILESKGIVNGDSFVGFVRRAKPIFIQRYPFLAFCPTDNLEGFLFPDTYFLAKGDDASVIVDLCLAQFQRKMLKAWEADQGKIKEKYGFYQMLTLASLIECEAQRQVERPLIASVFLNRLAKGMALASDPTVLYALGVLYKPVVTYADLAVESEYNTYRRKGLPPTPICSPGLASFEAALNPANTRLLFFVADGQGGHYFTQSYVDHLAAQRKK